MLVRCGLILVLFFDTLSRICSWIRWCVGVGVGWKKEKLQGRCQSFLVSTWRNGVVMNRDCQDGASGWSRLSKELGFGHFLGKNDNYISKWRCQVGTQIYKAWSQGRRQGIYSQEHTQGMRVEREEKWLGCKCWRSNRQRSGSLRKTQPWRQLELYMGFLEPGLGESNRKTWTEKWGSEPVTQETRSLILA